MTFLERSIDLHRTMVERLDLKRIEEIARRIASAYRSGKKLIVLGNGGSSADAVHFTAELEGQLSSIDKGRRPLRALSPCNLSAVTAIANDFGYDHVFERFVDANADADDVVVGISTSGNSPNVLKALEAGKRRGAFTIGLTGGTGGRLRETADLTLIVPAENVSIIQEGHIMAYHRICALVVRELFDLEVM